MIRFELLEDMTDSDCSAKARVHISGVAVELHVYNILNVEQGSFLLSGNKGDLGLAVLHENKLWITQIEVVEGKELGVEV